MHQSHNMTFIFARQSFRRSLPAICITRFLQAGLIHSRRSRRDLLVVTRSTNFGSMGNSRSLFASSRSPTETCMSEGFGQRQPMTSTAIEIDSKSRIPSQSKTASGSLSPHMNLTTSGVTVGGTDIEFGRRHGTAQGGARVVPAVLYVGKQSTSQRCEVLALWLDYQDEIKNGRSEERRV